MKLSLYQRIALRRDIPEHGLKAGDVAMLVDYAPGPSGQEDGGILEVFNAIGESIKVIIVGESQIEALRPDEIPAVRLFSAQG